MEDISQALNSTQLLNDTKLDYASVQLGITLFRISYFTIVLLLGVPGNSLILRVYWTKTLQTSTQVFIMTLAWADLAVCLFKVALIVNRFLMLMGQDETPVVIELLLAFETTAITTSFTITAVIAVDRYDCICRPHRRFFTHRRGKIAAWASFLFSVVVNIPQYVGVLPNISIPGLPKIRLAFHALNGVTAFVMVAVCYSLVYKAIKQHVKVGASSLRTRNDHNDCSTNRHANLVLEPSPIINGVPKPSTSKVRKEVWVASVPTQAARLRGKTVEDHSFSKCSTSAQQVLATDLQTRTSLDVEPETNGKRRRPEHPSNVSQLQRKTTKMLFVTSVVFFMTWVPYWILIIVSFAVQSGLNIDPIIPLVLQEVFLILYINNVVNPFIYGIANRRFRKDCREVIRKFKLC